MLAGVVYQFTVTLYDTGNNRLTKGGDSLTITIEPGQDLIELFDQHDGSYLVEYKILSKGQYTLNVVTNDDVSNTKTRTIEVIPNQSEPAPSTITFDDHVLVDYEYTVVTQIYDSFGNEVTDA